jgi:hypothetical protein
LHPSVPGLAALWHHRTAEWLADANMAGPADAHRAAAGALTLPDAVVTQCAEEVSVREAHKKRVAEVRRCAFAALGPLRVSARPPSPPLLLPTYPRPCHRAPSAAWYLCPPRARRSTPRMLHARLRLEGRCVGGFVDWQVPLAAMCEHRGCCRRVPRASIAAVGCGYPQGGGHAVVSARLEEGRKGGPALTAAAKRKADMIARGDTSIGGVPPIRATPLVSSQVGGAGRVGACG